MNNFLEFIKEAVSVYKELLSSMPSNNIENKIKFNEKILEIEYTYKKYKETILNFLQKKVSMIKPISDYDYKEVKLLETNILNLEEDMYFINPLNSSIDKLKFDNYSYIFENYSKYSFDFLNKKLELSL